MAAKEKAYDVNLILATNSAKKSMPEAAAADGYESGDQGLHQPLLQAAFRGTAASGRAAGEGADRLATPFGEPSAPSNSSAGQPSRGNVWDEVPAVARGVSEKEHEERRQSLDTLIQDNSCRRVLASLRVCDSCLSSLLAHLLRQEATCRVTATIWGWPAKQSWAADRTQQTTTTSRPGRASSFLNPVPKFNDERII